MDKDVQTWLRRVYPGEIAGGNDRADPDDAARMFAADPGLVGQDPYLACASGDESLVRAAIRSDPAWVDRPGGPVKLPPLVAVTHSGLVRLPDWRPRLHACARALLRAGADPNQWVGSRFPPDSLERPSTVTRLSALYGAAGVAHDPVLTRLLLDAGADPNDGESLYHSLESPECTRLLLAAGARVQGSNAIFRVLDLDQLESLRLLLAHGADPNEARPMALWPTPLFWAIRRRRSPAHVEALLAAGADCQARSPDGANARALALRYGLPDVAALLPAEDAAPDAAEQLVRACAIVDEMAARALLVAKPDLISLMTEAQLRMLPELAALGHDAAVRLMVRLGWPISVRAGDWNASALNHAIFRGDAALVDFLLAHGADWQELHGFGDNALGTLAWASLNMPEPDGNWPACAEALARHGLPQAILDPRSGGVILADQPQSFSTAVTEVLLRQT